MNARTRRRLLHALPALGAALAWRAAGAIGETPAPKHGPATKPIPSSGERLPVIGLGTWTTFDVGNDPVSRDACVAVMRALLDGGGTLIDSSPMYGSSQDVVGYGIERIGAASRVFSADKVWVSPGSRGPAQIETSRRRWGIARFDLLQVHNLLEWEEHLRTLFAMKAQGALRYVGVTTSGGRRHGELESIMRSQPLDFVQISYSVLEREVERRILPLARERGIAVIANRPFGEGALIRSVARHPLPAWAAEIDCANWAQFLLKFVVSHPAVTCAIPATTRVAHMRENVGAAFGRMPDEATRARMAGHVGRL